MPSSTDLERQIDQIIFSWDTGLEAFKKGWGLHYTRPSDDEIIDVMPTVLAHVAKHLETYRIYMHNYDCNKIVNYVAWEIKQQFGAKYPTAPLFFGHLHFIDESIRGASLFDIPYLPMIAENLEIFHREGHVMAPYAFIKGVDLTFSYCVGSVVPSSAKSHPTKG
jgi:hypothetical protein